METTKNTSTVENEKVNGGELKVAPVVPIKVYTSAKMDELKASYAEQGKILKTLEVGTLEFNQANLALYKIDNEIKAEEAHLRKLENQQIQEQKRNERVALADEMVNLHFAWQKIEGDKKASVEEKNAAKDAYLAAREIVVNELTARYATNTASKPATEGVAKTAGRGAKGDEIITLFKANREAGMADTDNKKAIELAGHARGTVGAVVLAWQREVGEKD